MDAAKRFLTQHIEFEAEWETAFNLQLKLHDCIALMVQWCAADEATLLAAYKATLRHLPKQCDVSTKKVTGKELQHPGEAGWLKGRVLG